MKRLKFRSNVGGVRVEPMVEPLVMQTVMAGSEAPPSQRVVRPPQYSLGSIFKGSKSSSSAYS